MKIKIFVMAVVLLLSGFLLSARAQSSPCGCADKQDLLYALNISQMAIQELNSRLELLKDREIKSGKIETYSDEGYKKLRESLAEALYNVRVGEREIFGGLDMNPRDCSLIEEGTQSECARQIE